MIKIDNLSLSFGEKVLFVSAQAEIPDNKLTVVLGSNGTGKTTLFKIISGNLKAESGKVSHDFKKIFFLPQNIKYPDGLTLFEYVTSFFYATSFKWFLSKEEITETEKILNLLDLTDRKNILIEKLSSGELQKANIAAALLSKADCLLLDEPTSNMDLTNQIKTTEILKKLQNHGITCVMITHDLNSAAAFGGYFIGLNKEHKIISGQKSEFFTEENLKNIFGIDFNINKSNEDIIISVKNTNDIL
ncbi:MAG: ABC transporter ATP-binding protein [Candidatus Gastranaerophilales bacterium]|nr:ABC transporter ATP-binding protein [Candidatus Gastranaerophilales bacterium]